MMFITGHPVFVPCRSKIETRGKENIPEGPVVFIGNHQGYFDIPLMITQMDKPNPLIAKKKFKKFP